MDGTCNITMRLAAHTAVHRALDHARVAITVICIDAMALMELFKDELSADWSISRVANITENSILFNNGSLLRAVALPLDAELSCDSILIAEWDLMTPEQHAAIEAACESTTAYIV